ncbi:MAG: hypothetical protein ACP5QR_16315 [Rhizomicrobium sp.]
MKTKTPSRASGALKIGRRDFAKISAVEEIHLSARVEVYFAEFDRKGLSHAERRAALLRKYGRKV